MNESCCAWEPQTDRSHKRDRRSGPGELRSDRRRLGQLPLADCSCEVGIATVTPRRPAPALNLALWAFIGPIIIRQLRSKPVIYWEFSRSPSYPTRFSDFNAPGTMFPEETRGQQDHQCRMPDY